MSKTSLALCCSMLSCTGFIFLLVIGILVCLQPEYMKISKDVKSAPLFGSAFLYGALFVGSTVYYRRETQKNELARYHMLAKSSDERKPLLQNPTPDDVADL
ncbi:hypothetical protein P43SY_008265 [Pythium insidiosum]|uniref:Transmembrane protein n=1 Tax=Pythium insidiosum TaxID=114742 RepID=A0AAD5LTF4_PYTIN|nr:hypothetical protein P43SY_008265 [Pythium insidiosum]KAJ0395048.1 hypothetical protein ATCC90586_000407 [Pythium insidiosum]